MKKILKKIMLVLLVAFMLVPMAPVNQTKADDGKYTIYAKVPESWGTPYLWAWSTSGGGDLFRTWPGELMNDNGDGYYTYTVSDKYLNFLLSNGGDTKTQDIVVNGTDVEVIVNDDCSYVINYRDVNSQQWENGINVTVKVPDTWANPYLWAWDEVQGDVFEKWPGAPMTANGSTYSLEVADWTTGIIVNANNAGIQTSDIIIEPGKDVWITVNSESDFQVQYTAFEVEETTPAPGGEEVTTTDSNNTTTSSPTQTPGGSSGGDKGNNNNFLYIVIPVAVFVVIILIVTFTGNNRNKKHSQYVYEEENVAKDINIDDKDLDIDVDDDVDIDDIDV